MARECGQAGGQPSPPSSAPVPDNSVPHPVPDDSDPVPATGSGDDGDLSSVSSDHPDPPAPDPVPSYLSLTVDDIPRRPCTKQCQMSFDPVNCLSFSCA